MKNGNFFSQLTDLIAQLRAEKKDRYNRYVSIGDLFSDRNANARAYGFGEGSTCYDNVLILGDVKVGRHVWIGPNVVLDGTGGLSIGDYCSISAGVQIYSHDSIDWSISFGKKEVSIGKRPTVIGNGVYLGPHVVVQKNVYIGDRAVIGAHTLVNKDIPANSRAWGAPVNIIDEFDADQNESPA